MDNELIIRTEDDFMISLTHTISNSRGIVLWLHGITVNKDEYLNFFKDGSDFIAKSGYDSIRIDFRGHGKSSGTSLDFSISGQMFDVDATMKYISDYYKANDIPIYIVGCSFGAPAAIYAALNYDKISNLVLIAPVLSYQRTFLHPETEWAQEIFNINSLLEMSTTKQLHVNDNFVISNRLVEEMKIMTPDVVIPTLDNNVVIIHGEQDSMVPFDVSRQVASKCTNVRFYPFKNMDHGFNDIEDENGTDKRSIDNKVAIYELILETLANDKR